MIRTLAAQIKEYKKASIITPVFMILEVVFETLIPFLMASIIDDGVEAGNMHHIYAVGAFMIAAALAGLFCGVMGAGNTEPGPPRDLPGIFGRPCLTIFRPFPLPVWINSVPRDW